jgi:uncharacterized membrane protein YgcG
MSNSNNDVFMDIESQTYYVLLSGRWYTSKSLDGEWSYVPGDKLPPDFAKIPPGSAKGNVLVSVPNTTQAKDALIQTEIPQTAAVEKSKAHLTVTYDGEPKFVKIKGTSMKYAVNTTTPVIFVDNRYYACDNAVWFVAPTPNGPWVVAENVPQEIQNIPPDCPIYNVKYVYIYSSTPSVVYVGYTPEYFGWYPYYGTVVYGTGYYYPAWYGNFYCPTPATFGFGVHYNSYTNSWTFGFSWSNGFNTVAYGWNNMWHNNGWWGPGHYIYHPVYVNNGNININRNITINDNNFNRHWNVPNQIHVGNKTFNIHQETVRNNLYQRGNNINRAAPQRMPSSVNNARLAKNTPNNVLLDKEGNVYRNQHNQWQRSNGRTWQEAKQPGNVTAPRRNVNEAPKVPQYRAKQGVPQTQMRGNMPARGNVPAPEMRTNFQVPNQVVHDYQAREHFSGGGNFGGGGHFGGGGGGAHFGGGGGHGGGRR